MDTEMIILTSNGYIYIGDCEAYINDCGIDPEKAWDKWIGSDSIPVSNWIAEEACLITRDGLIVPLYIIEEALDYREDYINEAIGISPTDKRQDLM